LRGKAPVPVNLGANGAKFRFRLIGRRQIGQRGVGALMRSFSLATIARETGMGFGQRGFARGVAIDLTLGRGMALARRIGFALRGTPGFAGGGLGGGRRLQFGLGVFQRLPLVRGVGAGLFQLVFDIDEARAFGETPCGAGRRVRSRDKTVPAPDVAFQRHQPLAGL
jgi:hypothetical protein